MKQVASSSEDEEGGSPPISLIENLPIIIAITAAPPIDEPPVMDGTERGVGSALQEKGGKQKKLEILRSRAAARVHLLRH